MSNFRVGQRVVCVNDSYPSKYKELMSFYGVSIPKKDKTYTIRSFEFDGIYLIEIVNPLVPVQNKGMVELCFKPSRFRPIDELSNTTYDEVMQWIESGQPIETLN